MTRPLLAGIVTVAMLLSACGADAAMTRFVVRPPVSTPAEATLYLAGNATALGGWSPSGVTMSRQDDGTFVAEVDLPAGSTAEFKVTRGGWETVEKTADGGEVANRAVRAGDTVTIEVAAWADQLGRPAGAPLKSTATGDLRIHKAFASTTLNNARDVRVWLPPGYEVGDARYPVLYLHDGQNLFDGVTSFAGEWQADETAARLINEKSIRQVILVGVDNAGAARLREYGAEGSAFLQFLAEELKPFIDKTYRTLPDRENTFIGGSSMGGLISLEALRTHGDVFGGALILSPALWWDDARLLRTVQASADPLPGLPRVFLSMGTAEGNQAEAETGRARRLGEKLQSTLPAERVRVVIVELGQHNEAAWAKVLPDGLRFLLPVAKQ